MRTYSIARFDHLSRCIINEKFTARGARTYSISLFGHLSRFIIDENLAPRRRSTYSIMCFGHLSRFVIDKKHAPGCPRTYSNTLIGHLSRFSLTKNTTPGCLQTYSFALICHLSRFVFDEYLASFLLNCLRNREITIRYVIIGKMVSSRTSDVQWPTQHWKFALLRWRALNKRPSAGQLIALSSHAIHQMYFYSIKASDAFFRARLRRRSRGAASEKNGKPACLTYTPYCNTVYGMAIYPFS